MVQNHEGLDVFGDGVHRIAFYALHSVEVVLGTGILVQVDVDLSAWQVAFVLFVLDSQLELSIEGFGGYIGN